MAGPDFTRKATPAPAAGSLPVNLVELPSDAPLRAGEVYVSDTVRKTLEPFGYKDGDPIPKDFSERIADVKRRMEQDDQLIAQQRPTSPTTVTPQKILDISQMSPAYIAEITTLLQHAKQQEAAIVAEERLEAQTVPENADPTVAQAIRNIRTEPTVVNDLTYKPPTVAAPATTSPVYTPPATPVPATSTPATSTPATPPAAPLSPEIPVAVSPAGSVEPIKTCPRCHLDLARPFAAEPTEGDKQKFLVAILGGKRFEKTYELLGGALLVTFRSLTSAESRLAFQQLMYDTKAGRIDTEAEYFMQLQDYRLTMGLASLGTRDGKVLHDLAAAGDVPYDPDPDKPNQTVLVQLLEWTLTNVLTQEYTRRIIGQHHQQFQRIVESLEAMSAEPNFWSGIAQQH